MRSKWEKEKLALLEVRIFNCIQFIRGRKAAFLLK
jgi:hypothetical protein